MMLTKDIIIKIENKLEKASNIHFAYKILIIIAIILLIFFPNINQYLHKIFDSHAYYYDDAMFLPSFHQHLSDPIAPDYIKTYTLNVMMGEGFKTALAFVYEHPDVQILIPLIKVTNLIISVCIIGIVAWEIGGAAICFATIAFFLSSPEFFYQSINGLIPRMFTYSFMAMAILFMIRKNIYAIATLTIISAFFYPQSAFILGTTMAIWLLFIPKENFIAVSKWNLYKKLSLLIVTGLFTCIAVIPQIIASLKYGRRLTSADIPAYPEIGVAGLFNPQDSLPYLFVWRDLALSMRDILFYKLTNPFAFTIGFLFIFFVIGNSFKNIYTQNPKCMSVIVLMIAGLITHIMAYFFSPYLYIANRYLVYTFPLFIIFMMPLAIEKFIGKYIGNRQYIASALTVFFISIYSMSGYNAFIIKLENEKEYRFKAYEFIETTPKDSLIAGWPNGVVNQLQLFSHRNILISAATHYVFQKDYTDEMRKRMHAIIDVYFAKSAAPLLRLRDEFKVTHFIVDKEYFTEQSKFSYFQPFQDIIKEKLKDMNLKDGILMSNKVKTAIIHEDENFLIIDLNKL